MTPSQKLRSIADSTGLDGIADAIREIANEIEHNNAPAVPQGEQATIAGLDAASGHLSTLLDDSVLMLKQLRQMVDDLHERWSNGGKPERGEFELLDRVDDWLSCRPDSMVTAPAPAQEPVTTAEVSARYRFLMALLIDRGVLTDRRYSNGTWSLQGIALVDDSGLRGAGRTPEEAIDDAIEMARLNPNDQLTEWRETHEQIAQEVGLTDEAVNDAAKVLAERFDYPWEHMPEEGRKNMRIQARAVIEAAFHTKGGK